MTQDARPVSIVGVGFAGVMTLVRRWPYGLAVVASPLAATLAIMALSRLLGGTIRSPILVTLLLVGLWLLSLAVAQLAAFHGQPGLRRMRKTAPPTAWISDLGRFLVPTVVWLLAAAVLQFLFYEACETTGLNDKDWAEPGVAAGSLILLALPLIAMGFAAAAAFAERRWMIWRRPPAWPDMWRILVGYLLVGAQLGAIWWAFGTGFVWLTRPEVARSVGLVGLTWLRLGGVGLALGLSMLCVAPAWAQAWRQSLGRAIQDPASVFD
jgi:hypothetical protein